MKLRYQSIIIFTTITLAYGIACCFNSVRENLAFFYGTTFIYAGLIAGINYKFIISRIEKINSETKSSNSNSHNEINSIEQKLKLSSDELSAKKNEYNRKLEEVTERFNEENLKLKQAIAEQELLEYSKTDNTNYVNRNAEYDELTSLPNQLFFNEILNKTLSHSKRQNKNLAVLLINLDDFQEIEKKFSKADVDLIIQEISKRLKSALRTEDILAKLEGDEFILLLNELTQSKFAGTVAEKLLTACKHSIVIHDQTISITASMGIAVSPTDGESLEQLLKNANTALFKAKKFSKGSYQYYTDSFNLQAREHIKLEAALKRALESDQLSLHYQPKFKIKTGSIVGVEALMRWAHPEYGLISPAQFIPLAEETGYISQITEWALYEACRMIKYWQDEGYQHLTVGVKLSLKQFTLPNLAKLTQKALKRSMIPPQYLELEITEQGMMSNPTESSRILNELKDLGILISIDHFGKGITSISYLKEFPFNTLKIDSGYIKGIPHSPNDTAITNAIIALAHQLGIGVVGEGIETAEQVEFLTAHDCDYMQGYFLGHPLPANKLQAQLTKLKDEVMG